MPSKYETEPELCKDKASKNCVDLEALQSLKKWLKARNERKRKR